MAAVNDIISATIITQQGGVQMSNALYFEIDDLGNDPSLGEAALDILNAYTDSIKAQCSSSWASTCIVLENISNDEGRTIVQNTTSGTGAGPAHGPDQVLRMNQYAGQPDFLKVHRGAFNQSGIMNSLSTRGRWNDLTAFGLLRTFLHSTTAMTPNWHIQPYLRWKANPGPFTPYSYTPTTDVQASSRCFKLGSRKSRLCGTS